MIASYLKKPGKARQRKNDGSGADWPAAKKPPAKPLTIPYLQVKGKWLGQKRRFP